MSTERFATLVDIMKKITQTDTLTKLQTVLTNSTADGDTNEEDGQDYPSSTGDDIADEPRKNCKIRKQSKYLVWK